MWCAWNTMKSYRRGKTSIYVVESHYWSTKHLTEKQIETEEIDKLPAPAVPDSCRRGGEPGKDGLRSSKGKKTTWDMSPNARVRAHCLHLYLCLAPHRRPSTILAQGWNGCIFLASRTMTHLNVMCVFVLNESVRRATGQESIWDPHSKRSKLIQNRHLYFVQPRYFSHKSALYMCTMHYKRDIKSLRFFCHQVPYRSLSFSPR